MRKPRFIFLHDVGILPVTTLEYKRLPETIYLHSRVKTAVLKLSMHNLQMEPFTLVEKIVLVSSTSLRVHGQ